MQWNICNGRTVRFWRDNWLPSKIVLQDVLTQPIDSSLASKTVDYFSDGNGNWKLQGVLHLILESIVEQIHGCTSASEHFCEDKPSWP
jgi:hypothetical protein